MHKSSYLINEENLFLEYINYLVKIEENYIKKLKLNIQLAENEEEYLYEKDLIHNFHDTSIRKILSNKREAALFINKVLNLSDKEKIVEDKLEPYESSLITRGYLNREADIVYKRKDMDVFFLIEHQSRVDYDMPIRIMEYITQIISTVWYSNKNSKKNRKYPLVIPIVLYIGKQKWDVEKYISDNQIVMPGYKKEYGKYSIFDANNYSDYELLKEKGVLSKIILLEKTKNESELNEKYIKISKQKLSNKERDMIVEYLCNISSTKMSSTKVNQIKKLFLKGENTMLADIFIEKERKAWIGGRNEGKKEIAKRLLKSNVNMKNIKEWTKLTEEEINEIKNTLKKSK